MAGSGRRTARGLARFSKWASFAAALAAALLLGLWLALSLGWQRDALREEFAAAVAEALGAEVSLEAFEGPLFPLVSLRGLRIVMPDGLRLEVDRLDVWIDLLAYYRRDEFRISSLRANGLRLHSGPARATEASPALQEPSVDETDAQPAPDWLARVVLERVLVRDGSLTLELPYGDQPSTLEWGFELRASDVPLGSAREAVARMDADARSTFAWRDAGGGVRMGGSLAIGLASGVVSLSRIELEEVLTGGARGEGSFDLGAWLEQRPAALQIDLQGDDLLLSADGQLKGSSIDRMSIQARLEQLSLAETLVPEMAPSAGRLDLAGQVRGDPPDLVGELTLRGSGLVVRGEKLGVLSARAEALGGGVFQVTELALPEAEVSVALEGVTRVEIEDSRIGLQDLVLVIAGHRARIDGRIGADAFDGLRVRTQGLDLEAVSELAALPIALGGALDADLVLTGPFGFPGAAGALSWQQPRLGDATVERLDLSLETGDGVAGLQGSLWSGGRNVLSARARAPMAPIIAQRWDELVGSGETALWLKAEGFDLALVSALIEKPSVLAGSVDISLDLVGPLASPKGEGRLDLAQGMLRGVAVGAIRAAFEGHEGAYQITELALPDLPMPVHLAPGGRVELREDDVALRGLRLFTEDREILHAEATLPYPHMGTAALDQIAASPLARVSLRGSDFDLSLLEAFTPAYASGILGSASFDLVLQGDPVEPSFRGALELADGSLLLKPLRTPLTPVVAKLVFDNREVSVSELRVGPPGASASMTGIVKLQGLRPSEAELDLTLEDLPIRRPGVLRTLLRGEAQVRGSVQAPELIGRIRLGDTRVEVGRTADSGLQEIRVIAKGAPRTSGSRDFVESAEAPSTFLERSKLDLVLEIPEETRATGGGADLQLFGNLELKKEPLDRVRLSGSVETLRGSYRIQNRNFTIRRGVVRFDGGRSIDPSLDVEAESRVRRDILLIAFISGNLSDPQIRFDSEPPMSEDDVLSYLVLGRPAGEGGVTGSMTSAAASLAAGVALSELNEVLGSKYLVDTLEVRMEEDGGPVEVRVGKAIGSRVFVHYGHAFGIEQEDSAGIELRLNRNWSVSSEVSTQGSAGGDLVWSIEW